MRGERYTTGIQLHPLVLCTHNVLCVGCECVCMHMCVSQHTYNAQHNNGNIVYMYSGTCIQRPPKGYIVVVDVQWNLYTKTTQGTSQRWSLKRSGLFTEMLYHT